MGFLLIIILIVGVYTAYTGLLKRETSKALHAVINFVVVFIVSASFIAYAPNYIQKSMISVQTSAPLLWIWGQKSCSPIHKAKARTV